MTYSEKATKTETQRENRNTPMTNEEWFCGLSTEEKAEWIIYKGNLSTKWGWVEWLKQEHKE